MDTNRASCSQCGREFHLALRTDVPTRDCGDAWIDDEAQALVFGCDLCLGRAQPAGPAASSRRRYARSEGKSAGALARRRAQRSGR
jgi:hypothetical protein